MNIDKRIVDDSLLVLEMELSNLYIKKDSENPWCILVPRREGIVELTDLSEKDRNVLLREITFVMDKMQIAFHPDKFNIGALGNIVPQFHFHIICRFRNDRSWPNSIFGVPMKKGLDLSTLNRWKESIKDLFK